VKLKRTTILPGDRTNPIKLYGNIFFQEPIRGVDAGMWYYLSNKKPRETVFGTGFILVAILFYTTA
jgi:hypothetical protein